MSVDAPEVVISATRHTADRFFRGSLNETVIAALAMLRWFIRVRSEGGRVIAVTPDRLPDTYEEPILPGIEDALALKWVWLVEREHPWRRQLWIKGRSVTAGDLARTTEIERWTAEEAAEEYELPIEAVQEAMRYLADNRELVLAEESENRLAALRATQAQPEAPVPA